MKFVLNFLFVVLSINTLAQKEKVFLSKSIDDYILATKKLVFNSEAENLFRSIDDFNNDGLNDLMISGYQSGEWGNAGGNWVIYFQKPNGSFEKCKTKLFFHHLGTYLNPGGNDLLIYKRLGCCEGLLAYHRFQNQEIILIKSQKIKNKDSTKQSKEIDSIVSANPNLEKIRIEQSKLEGKAKLIWE